MKLLYLITFTFLMAPCVVAQSYLEADHGDTLVISAPARYALVQWQNQYEGGEWENIPQQAPVLKIAIEKTPVRFRAQLGQDGCDPFFSGEVIVDLRVSTAVVSTVSATGITSTTATAGGEITSDGGSNVTARGVAYSTSTGPTLTGSFTSNGTGTGSFSSELTGLTPNTTYYLRAYATNSAGTAYGNEVSFTTEAQPVENGLPVVTTAVATNIGTASATAGGEITSDGGAAVTARGVAYSTSTGPTLSDAFTSNGMGTGSFSSELTGLTPNTTYYLRAYATNSAGTAYGNEVSFTTEAQPVENGLPVVTTAVATNIGTASATAGGEITSDGGAAVTARGVVYSTSTGPSVSDSFTSNGTGTGSFTSELTGLTPNTTYYLRAYATNSSGTAYGGEVSFVTQQVAPAPSKTILMFVAYEDTYYSEYVVAKEAFEKSGYTVDVRSSAWGTASVYMLPEGTTIEETANTLNGSSYGAFTTQFDDLFGNAWDAGLSETPGFVQVNGRIQDVSSMADYDALVIVGGTGALAYRLDGDYHPQGAGERTVQALEVQAAAEKLNTLALDALAAGKPVMAQCHSASLPAFWRVPNTTGDGAESLGYSLLKGGFATGFPEPDTELYLDELDINYNGIEADRVTVSSPHSSFAGAVEGKSKIITTRDWYPQTVAHGAKTLLSILQTYPEAATLQREVSVLILHGGPVDPDNCLYTNRANDVPCNYGTGDNLPADYTHLLALLQGGSDNDDFTFAVSDLDITSEMLPYDPGSGEAILNFLNQYEVVAFFKHWSTGMTDELQNALVHFADNGGGVLGLHHALYNDEEVTETGVFNKDILATQLFGAQSHWDGWGGSRTSYNLLATNHGHFISTYGIHYAPALPAPAAWSEQVLPAAANSSGSNYPAFNLFDELYTNMTFINPEFGSGINQVTPIFSNDQSPQNQVHTAGFVKLFDPAENGSVGRVAYFQAGENILNFSSASRYGQVIRNAVVWVASENGID